jgi:tetratricopeptide (TPR) repeat protein
MVESRENRELEYKIDLYIDGKLSNNEIDELWVELIQDEYYMDYLKTAASLKALVRETEQKKPRVHKMVTQRTWFAVAAVLLIAVTLSVFTISNDQGTAISPISSIELDYYRSAEGVVEETVNSDRIILAISAANRGETESALTMLDNLLEASQDVDETHKLLVTAGSILYNSGMYELAAERFEAGLELDSNDMLLLERNYWYLGNTYFQLNRIVEAKAALEKAYELNGAYSRIAASYIKALSE